MKVAKLSYDGPSMCLGWGREKVEIITVRTGKRRVG